MTFLQALILGVVQGATEFLPISSSGHLVIVPYLLGWDLPAAEAFVFDVLVQVATLVAVIAYFWTDLIAILRSLLHGVRAGSLLEEPASRLGVLLIIATLPAGVLGLAFKSVLERAFADPRAAAFFLLLTAGLLVVAERVGGRSRSMHALSWRGAVWVGLFQALALFPGISRSGATITGGMTQDLTRPDAARFSFLMSVPIMLAAGVSAGLDLVQIPNLPSVLPPFLAGFAVAAAVGYLSIRWLLAFLAHRPLTLFSLYCASLGAVTLIVSFVR